MLITILPPQDSQELRTVFVGTAGKEISSSMWSPYFSRLLSKLGTARFTAQQLRSIFVAERRSTIAVELDFAPVELTAFLRLSWELFRSCQPGQAGRANTDRRGRMTPGRSSGVLEGRAFRLFTYVTAAAHAPSDAPPNFNLCCHFRLTVSL
ncbi:hypothetical protein WJX82_011140 [Trebouxia sp. C0006]